MDKLMYKDYNASNTDIAFASSNGYVNNPGGELETRKQLSYPLKEIKTFINDAIPVDSQDRVVQLVVSSTNALRYRLERNGTLYDITGGIPSGGTTGQVLTKRSNTDLDVEWDDPKNAFSFIGMVVQGTNLDTEEKVKIIYGANTSWTKLSSVAVISEHVFGNGMTVGLTSGFKNATTGAYNKKGLKYSTTSPSHVTINADTFGATLPATSGGSGSSDSTVNNSAMGIITKEIAGENPEHSGLVVDTATVYMWERTA